MTCTSCAFRLSLKWARLPTGTSQTDASWQYVEKFRYIRQENRICHRLRHIDLDPPVFCFQFEVIHRFTDGNGRTGRILNALLLAQAGGVGPAGAVLVPLCSPRQEGLLCGHARSGLGPRLLYARARNPRRALDQCADRSIRDTRYSAPPGRFVAKPNGRNAKENGGLCYTP